MTNGSLDMEQGAQATLDRVGVEVPVRGSVIWKLAAGDFVNTTLYGSNTVTGSAATRQTIGVAGALVNHGTLSILGGSSANESATMQLVGDTTLSGSGQTVLGGRSSSFIGNSDNAEKTLTIAAGHTLRGSGMLGLSSLMGTGALMAPEGDARAAVEWAEHFQKNYRLMTDEEKSEARLRLEGTQGLETLRIRFSAQGPGSHHGKNAQIIQIWHL